MAFQRLFARILCLTDVSTCCAKDEDFPIDTWQTNYRMRKARDRGGIPVTKGVMDDKAG